MAHSELWALAAERAGEGKGKRYCADTHGCAVSYDISPAKAG